MLLSHGQFEAEEREQAFKDFRDGKKKVLITTDAWSRGIDVSSVNMVINYEVPMTRGPGGALIPAAETYLHRIGRTGRFGRVGVSITFVHDRASFQALEYIGEKYGIDLVRLNTDDWNETEERVNKVLKSRRAKSDYRPDEDQALQDQLQKDKVDHNDGKAG